MTREQCSDIARRIIAMSRADETFVALTGIESASLPFIASTPQTPVAVRDHGVQLSVRVGEKYASTTGNQFDDASLRGLLDAVLASAALLPPVPSIVPYPGAIDVAELPLGTPPAGADASRWRRASAQTIIDRARRDELLVTGKCSVTSTFTAVASSNGLFAYQPSSVLQCIARAFPRDGASAGYGEQRAYAAADIDAAALAGRACEKARAWRNPSTHKAGRITVVLEPQAVAELLPPILRQFDQQAINDNRSFLRKLDGASRVGSLVFSEHVTIHSDPKHAQLPSMPFTLDGQAVPATSWVRNGTVETVTQSRSLARKSGQPAVPFPTNIFFEGGTKSTEELIAATEYGLLVSGFGQVVVEDPVDGVLAASTRDGLFLIEKGRVTRPIQNMTMRETAIHLLKMTELVGIAERTQARGLSLPMLLPALQVRDVRFAGHSGTI
jgi:predicted Zn-dependent protease